MELNPVIAVVDVEATSLPDLNPLARIIEIGAVLVDLGPEDPFDGAPFILEPRFEAVVNPGYDFVMVPWYSDAEKIHHIPRSQVLAAEKVEIVAERFRLWLTEYRVVSVTSFHTDCDLHTLFLGSDEWLGAMFRMGLKQGPCLKKMANRGGLKTNMTRAGVKREGDAHRALSDAEGAAGLAVQWAATIRDQLGRM